MFGQTAEPIGIKLGIRIFLKPEIVLDKSRSRSERHTRENGQRRRECRRRENGGAVGTPIRSDRGGRLLQLVIYML